MSEETQPPKPRLCLNPECGHPEALHNVGLSGWCVVACECRYFEEDVA